MFHLRCFHHLRCVILGSSHRAELSGWVCRAEQGCRGGGGGIPPTGCAVSVGPLPYAECVLWFAKERRLLPVAGTKDTTVRWAAQHPRVKDSFRDVERSDCPSCPALRAVGPVAAPGHAARCWPMLGALQSCHLGATPALVQQPQATHVCRGVSQHYVS